MPPRRFAPPIGGALASPKGSRDADREANPLPGPHPSTGRWMRAVDDRAMASPRPPVIIVVATAVASARSDGSDRLGARQRPRPDRERLGLGRLGPAVGRPVLPDPGHPVAAGAGRGGIGGFRGGHGRPGRGVRGLVLGHARPPPRPVGTARPGAGLPGRRGRVLLAAGVARRPLLHPRLQPLPAGVRPAPRPLDVPGGGRGDGGAVRGQRPPRPPRPGRPAHHHRQPGPCPAGRAVHPGHRRPERAPSVDHRRAGTGQGRERRAAGQGAGGGRARRAPADGPRDPRHPGAGPHRDRDPARGRRGGARGSP
jgi:hypothetical protein